MPNDSVWVPKYCEVCRYRDRVENLIESGVDPTTAVDAITDFMLKCYSLRDWLTRAGFTGASTWVTNHEHLGVCEGLANSDKHGGLDLGHHPYIHPPYRLFVGQAIVLSSTTPPYDSLVEGSGNYRVSDGTARRVWDINPFMTGCMEEWNEFLLGCRAKIPVCLRDSLLPTRG